jgi:hypothetical protein
MSRAHPSSFLSHFPVNTDPPIGRNEIAAGHTSVDLGATRRAYALNW